MKKESDRFRGFKVGDKVNFHSIINGPVTSTDHEITHLEIRGGGTGCGQPYSTYAVAFISNFRGCVSIDALSDFE
ncbi:MAG: hypothetical protein KAV87_17400 [Desulfobacteraceae bacterium]|nr:hypothetical protein [Desulfobacteraceae bacterium]